MKPCRNCGAPAEADRQHWATVVCHACVPPTDPPEERTAKMVRICLADSLAVVQAKLGGAGPQ